MKGKRKKDKRKQGVFTPVCITLLIIGIAYMSFLYYIQMNTRPVSEDKSYKVYTISSGNLSSISSELKKYGIIRDSFSFKVMSILSGVHGRFSKGDYELSPSMTTDELITVLQTGGIKEEGDIVTVTIPEGYTIEDMAGLLYEKGVIYDKEIFLDLCRTGEKAKNIGTYDNIEAGEGAKYVLEGYLFPDTYEFMQNSSAESVINRMLSRFSDIYSEEYQSKAKEYGMSVDDVITLASIIEKEGKSEDFSKVSSVLHNRIETGMPLQVDATIRYVDNLENSISITSKQYGMDSPYNTYKNNGMPPTPICSPSENAIRAVLYPDEEYLQEGYLYFCLTDYRTGKMVYAKTYDEHLSNVKRYRDNWKEYDEAIE